MNKPRVCSFESRRNAEMRSLIQRHGGEPTVVASMQEVPLDDNTAAIDFATRVEAGEVDIVIFMTGVGAQTLRDTLEQSSETESKFKLFVEALKVTSIVLRGPKPKAVLTKWGLQDFHVVPEPNTWRELVTLLDESSLEIANKTVAVQEYGVPNRELYAALEQRGATVLPVPVYRWKLPNDTEPLRKAIEEVVAGTFDAVMFTSANQVRNVLQVADDAGLRDRFLEAVNACVVASIGPTCSETIVAEGMTVGFEASPPKMGPFVRGTLATLESRD
jgi:uroporphyrinogen-III synthase